MGEVLDSINTGFGISYVGSGAFDLNRNKVLACVPILGIGMSLYFLKSDANTSYNKFLVARGFLGGSVVGWPIVLTADVIASLTTQVVNAVRACKGNRFKTNVEIASR